MPCVSQARGPEALREWERAEWERTKPFPEMHGHAAAACNCALLKFPGSFRSEAAACAAGEEGAPPPSEDGDPSVKAWADALRAGSTFSEAREAAGRAAALA